AASSLNSALNVFLVVDLMCSPKVIYEVIISPLFRWPKLVCHYSGAFNIIISEAFKDKLLSVEFDSSLLDFKPLSLK
ncbi:hypothetical protein ACRN9O_07855, partial [Shewanella oncorhynchi]